MRQAPKQKEEAEGDEPVVYSPLPLCNSEGHILDYLVNNKNMDVFNMGKELVGKWDDGEGKIVFNEDVKVRPHMLPMGQQVDVGDKVEFGKGKERVGMVVKVNDASYTILDSQGKERRAAKDDGVRFKIPNPKPEEKAPKKKNDAMDGAGSGED